MNQQQTIVTAPPGSYPGQRLQVTTPSGQVATVVVPDGVQPGGQFIVFVPGPVVQEPRPSYNQQPTYNPQPPPQERSTGSPVTDYGRASCDGSLWKCCCCNCYLCCCCCCLTHQVKFVRTGEVAVVEKYQKFRRIAPEGELLLSAPCGWLCPFLNEDVARYVSLRVRDHAVRTTAKTRDNVFVDIEVTVLFKVPGQDSAYDAAYKLTSVNSQLSEFVEDALRQRISLINIDDVFTASKDLARAVYDHASPRMSTYGFEILTTLVTGIEPDPKVKASMNEINAARRIKEAQVHQAEATKAIDIKRAEGAAEAKYLQGVGLARMRKAIVDGIGDSITDLADSSDAGEASATDILLTVQYLDALEQIAQTPSTLYLPHGIEGLDVMKSRLDTFLAAAKPHNAKTGFFV